MSVKGRQPLTRGPAREDTSVARPLVIGVVLVWSLASCGSSTNAPPVATVAEVVGVVEAATANREDWSAAAEGAPLRADDAVRTGPRSRARLSVTGGGGIRMSENCLLRLRRGSPSGGGKLELALDLGSAEIDAAGSLIITTTGGRAQLEAGSHVRVSTNGRRGTVEVIVGRAELLSRTSDGGEATQRVALRAGEGLVLEIGRALVERFTIDVGPAEIDRSGRPSAPPGTAPTHVQDPPVRELAARAHGQLETADTRHADVTVNAGDILVLHDARPPLIVRLRFGPVCPDGAIVDLDPGGRDHRRLAGATAIVARLHAGRHPYRVRCASDPTDQPPRAAGVLTVKRDSGNVALARRAPTNTIEADGRRYTVLFQTRPPALTFSWSASSTSPPHRVADLVVSSSHGTQTFHARQSSVRLPSGTLPEGEYTWWFSTPDGARSTKTVVAILFDNTAPTAQFFRADRSKASAGAIDIDGVTVQGAQVSASGKTIGLDEHGRFRDTVAPLAGDDAVAVRIEMPRGEAHCYVRRRGDAR